MMSCEPVADIRLHQRSQHTPGTKNQAKTQVPKTKAQATKREAATSDACSSHQTRHPTNKCRSAQVEPDTICSEQRITKDTPSDCRKHKHCVATQKKDPSQNEATPGQEHTVQQHAEAKEPGEVERLLRPERTHAQTRKRGSTHAQSQRRRSTHAQA